MKTSQRHPLECGEPYKSLFYLEKLVPAFAEMTLRSPRHFPRFRLFHARERHCGLPRCASPSANCASYGI